MASVTNLTAFYLLDSGFLASVFALASDLSQVVPCLHLKVYFFSFGQSICRGHKSCKFAGNVNGFILIVYLISGSN